ncbi:MAG: S8 family serine peptidase [Paenibacillaceae bacterium]
MRTFRRFLQISLAILLLLPAALPIKSTSLAAEPVFEHAIQSELPDHPITNNDKWIIKWNTKAPSDFIQSSYIINHIENLGIYIARPAVDAQLTEWLARWKNDPGVDYIHYSEPVELFATPNDELYSNQSYLQQIHAPEAWDITTENTSITIAIVDTGVDLEHPDLKGNLVAGVNLITPTSLPQDDHGHGTSVAGVIAAIGNNEKGVAGLAWKAKLMPIKAIESDGQGNEDKLGQGILYAVDHGAKIVVLSVGLHRYSPFLKEVSEYAEKKGVLLISAVGNEGKAVKYPAAYPTVLSVGGVGPDKKVMLESNYGPEVDIVAPWKVYTTALGGDYEFKQGTSMGAPQVAGAAALVWSQHPNLKPFEIRNLLMQSAEDIEDKGWDPYAGYGLLRIDHALTVPYKADMYEPNDQSDTARRLPLDTMVMGTLNKGSDQDWFYIDPPYRGSVELTFQFAGASGAEGVVITHYNSNQDKGTVYTSVEKQKIVIPVTSSRSRFQIKFTNPKTAIVASYQITTAFQIYRDDFEDNDRQYKAYSIAAEQQALTGTFHQVNDQDWFSILITSSGTLSASVFPDTVRMDVAMMLQKSGEKPFLVDLGLEGVEETIDNYEVTPGRYYLLVSNVISDEAFPVTGEYELKVDFSPKLTDPNEPNDKYYAATNMSLSINYKGLIDPTSDLDWFTFTLTQDSAVQMRVRDISNNAIMLMTLLDQKQTQIQVNLNTLGETRLLLKRVLPKGTYYIKLGANRASQDIMYRLDVSTESLIAGFQDIRGHWAQKNIVSLVNRSIVSGYGDYTFRPNRTISRGEAIALIAQAFKLKDTTSINFKDLSSEHWAYDYIRQGIDAGIIAGYEDGSFRPDQAISRAEMAVMIAKALKMKGTIGTLPFIDINQNNWAAPYIREMKAKGYITGYVNNTFQPAGKATRAEYVTVLIGALD